MQIKVRILNNNLVAIVIKIAKMFAKSFSSIKIFCEQVISIKL